MIDLMDQMVDARLGWVHPRIRNWYPENQLRDQIATGLRTEADRLGDVDFGASYQADVGIGVGVPLDWANRRLDLPLGGWAVAGIRFRGRNVDRPFVDVIATSEPPTPDGMAVIAEAVVPEFRQFAPRCLRVEASDPAALVADVDGDARFGRGNSVDLYLVAGLVASLLESPRSAAYERIALRPGAAAALAERVAAIYAELSQRNPSLLQWATPEGEESLAECAGEGLLFEILAEGDPVGVLAAVRDDAHGMRGFSVQEICIDDRYRGQRLAAGAMQRLLKLLPAATGDVLWGTIHPQNQPSLRNSQSLGRMPVGGYAWITPAGSEGMPSADR